MILSMDYPDYPLEERTVGRLLADKALHFLGVFFLFRGG